MSISRATLCALALVAVGCTEPQSGIFSKDWCKPTIAGATQIIDDMEDGDGVPCSKKGSWYVDGTGTLTPAQGSVSAPAELAVARAESARAWHLTGAVPAGGTGILGVRLSDLKLSAFSEIKFWARSDGPPLEIRVALLTSTTAADGDHFVDVATVYGEWGDQGNQGTPNSIALTGLTKADGQVAITDDDRVSCQALEFQVVTESPSFGFWIDDVQLVPKL